MNEQSPRHGEIGHNSAISLLPEKAAFMEAVLADAAEAKDRLLDVRVGLEKLPETVNGDNAGVVQDFIAQCQGALKDWEAARKAAKKKPDELGKAIQAEFQTRAAPVEEALKKARAKLGEYQQQLAREEEARRREEAEKAAREAKEAQRKLDEAAAKATAAAQGGDREAAKEAQEALDSAATAAESAAKDASDADKEADRPVHVRGEYGTTTGYSRKAWKFEVTDIAKLPLSFLMVDEKMVRQWLTEQTKGGGTPPDVEGLRFFQESSFHVKGG